MTATSPAPAAPPVEPADTRAATPQGTRLWVLAAVTATLAFLVYGIALAGSQGAPLSGLPLWAFIAIALAGQQVSLVLQRRGGLAVSPGAVALALGLLYIQPGLVVLIIAASTLVTRLARTQLRAAMDTNITLLHVTVAGAVYSAFRFDDPFAWGTIAVAGSNATDAALEQADVELFGALANNVVAGLKYGHMDRSLAQLGELERKLAHQAYHDSLTGLANRALFLDLMQQALIRNMDREGVSSSSSSISITSRRSTKASVTQLATPCWSRSRSGYGAACEAPIRRRASAATSSPC